MAKEVHKPRNRPVSAGVMRFSRARMMQKRAAYKHASKKVAKATKKPAKEQKAVKARAPRSLDTQVKHRLKPHMKPFSKQQRSLRRSIVPGTVLILLTGVHKGKRVVFLKQLASGLLLVTGPFKVNGCPLRRVNQAFVIATKTRLSVSKVDVPERVNDTYFRRVKAERKRKGGDASGDIFAQSKSARYTLTEERKEDQKKVDSQLLSVIRDSKDSSLMLKYLLSSFSLGTRQYPHTMVF